MLTRCRRSRPSRSSFHTTRVSPERRALRHAISCGRSSFLPEALSSYNCASSMPAADNASRWRSVVCEPSAFETRTYATSIYTPHHLNVRLSDMLAGISPLTTFCHLTRSLFYVSQTVSRRDIVTPRRDECRTQRNSFKLDRRTPRRGSHFAHRASDIRMSRVGCTKPDFIRQVVQSPSENDMRIRKARPAEARCDFLVSETSRIPRVKRRLTSGSNQLMTCSEVWFPVSVTSFAGPSSLECFGCEEIEE